MERTIEDIIRDAEIAYKALCERLAILDDDGMWNEDEIDIIREAFKAEYEKRRAAAIKELEQKYSNTPIAEIDSENEIAIESMRVFLYNYCEEREECGECVMNCGGCDISKMSDEKVKKYYNEIQKGR